MYTNESLYKGVNVFKNFFSLLWFAVTLYNNTDIDPKLTKKLEKVIASVPKYKSLSKKVVVRVVNQSAINAFVAPFSIIFDPGKITIFVYAGLINYLGRDSRELIAVLLHELGHLVLGHIVTGLTTQILTQTIYGRLVISLYKKYKKGQKWLSVGIGALIILVGLTKAAMTSFISRAQEFQADEFVIQFGYAKAGANFDKKLESMNNVAGLTRKCGKLCQTVEKIQQFFSSHPRSEDRIKNVLDKEKIWKSLEKTKGKNIEELYHPQMVYEYHKFEKMAFNYLEE